MVYATHGFRISRCCLLLLTVFIPDMTSRILGVLGFSVGPGHRLSKGCTSPGCQVVRATDFVRWSHIFIGSFAARNFEVAPRCLENLVKPSTDLAGMLLALGIGLYPSQFILYDSPIT